MSVSRCVAVEPVPARPRPYQHTVPVPPENMIVAISRSFFVAVVHAAILA